MAHSVPSQGIWIFGYGSLCYNPGFEYQESYVGFIRGFKRRFLQGNIYHRGTQEKPGRVATLVEDEEGYVWGRAYRICGPSALSYLAERECKIGGYKTLYVSVYKPAKSKAATTELTQLPEDVIHQEVLSSSEQSWSQGGAQSLQPLHQHIFSTHHPHEDNLSNLAKDIKETKLSTSETFMQYLVKEQEKTSKHFEDLEEFRENFERNYSQQCKILETFSSSVTTAKQSSLKDDSKISSTEENILPHSVCPSSSLSQYSPFEASKNTLSCSHALSNDKHQESEPLHVAACSPNSERKFTKNRFVVTEKHHQAQGCSEKYLSKNSKFDLNIDLPNEIQQYLQLASDISSKDSECEHEIITEDALCYVATPDNPYWLGEATISNLASQICDTSGHMGHNIDYVLNLSKFIRENCPTDSDAHLFELEREILTLKPSHKVQYYQNVDGKESRQNEIHQNDYHNQSFEFSKRVPSKKLRCLNI